VDAAVTARVNRRAASATPSIAPEVRVGFGRQLRSWYRRNARDLPWRRTRDPYQILVSELMLQQTQVSRVVVKYGEFLERFPTLAHVARAKPARVMEAWEGLGYYARARNLHRLAREVTSANGADGASVGQLPSEPEALRALPGVGAYTAGAVASFAYERRAALVDTNVARVLKRVFVPNAQIKTTKGQRTIWGIADAILPRTGRATWTHTPALMELGALVCTARIAHCDRCPVRSYCVTGSKPSGRRAP
jgi:A/G-specific adenine glycosylase